MYIYKNFYKVEQIDFAVKCLMGLIVLINFI